MEDAEVKIRYPKKGQTADVVLEGPYEVWGQGNNGDIDTTCALASQLLGIERTQPDIDKTSGLSYREVPVKLIEIMECIFVWY